MTTQAVSGRRYFTKAWLMEQKSLIALLVLIAIVSTMSPNFFTVNNLFNILQQTSVNAIMAVGMTLVIQFFVYPGAYPTHGTWAALLLYLMAKVQRLPSNIMLLTVAVIN